MMKAVLDKVSHSKSLLKGKSITYNLNSGVITFYYVQLAIEENHLLKVWKWYWW